MEGIIQPNSPYSSPVSIDYPLPLVSSYRLSLAHYIVPPVLSEGSWLRRIFGKPL